MITIVCSSQYNLDEFEKHVIKTSGLHNKIEFLGYENKGEFSLTEIYNRGLKQAKYPYVVFCHDDITLETKQWGNKLIKQFEKNPEYGIIGVAGSKNLPASGKWWESPKQMYGRVQHTHEGKTWLSAYSEDLGQELERVVTVDGVFFAVDTRKIQTNFNESVEGYHFYDVTFCLENYLKEVNIGVSTLVRVNHQSIGMTNEQWESNRIIFSENHKESLPITVPKVLRKNQKLNIMFCSMAFNSGNIKEKTMLELAISFRKLGHNVIITSTTGGVLDKVAKKHNIKLAHIMEPPGFKLGDGKWQLNTPDGYVPSVDKTLYKLSPLTFDIIQVFNDELIDHFLRLYPDDSLVNTNFVDGLFLQDTGNDKVKKTINLKSNPEEYKNSENLNKIFSEYKEVL